MVYADREKVVTDEALQTIGSALWQALDIGAALAEAKQQAGQLTLPLIIESDDPAILQLPWETLYHPKYGFLAREPGFTLLRTIPSLRTHLPPVEKGPLRVLLFTSLPDDLDEKGRLQVEDEQARVQEALAGLEQDGQVILEMPDDGRFESFKQWLKTFKPQLIYLSGHGKFHHEPHKDTAWGTFLFEDEWGQGVEIHEAELVECFTDSGVQALVLSACQTGKSSSLGLSQGLSQRLYQQGLPHVIGMRESIFDQAGIQFAQSFFSAIGAHERVDVALQQARAAITRPLKESVYRDHDQLLATEISFGQWCLPMLLSQDLKHELIDWKFTPTPRSRKNPLNQTLSNISLPQRFLGRRRELRRYQNRLRRKEIHALLITGAGGMGKTALAGKLARTLEADGHEIYAYSAREEKGWNDFLLELELALDKQYGERYDRASVRCKDEAERARLLLRLLLSQHEKQIVLFFDNLESLQDSQTLALKDHPLQSWIQAALALGREGLKMVLTSRWRLKDWPETEGSEHYPLGKPVYGDFVAFARQQQLPDTFLKDYSRLRRVYAALGGNFRGLEFFAHAVEAMSSTEEQAFHDAIRQAEADAQADMALRAVIGQRSETEKRMLHRLLAYQTAVPADGIKKLALPDLPESERLLDELLAVSLVERYAVVDTATEEYQLAPLVRDWLQQNGVPAPDQALLQKAAEYQLHLLKHERPTLTQAMSTHQALTAAGLKESAHRLVLDWIVGPLNRAGLYNSLLYDWLPPACQATEAPTRASALGQAGKQYFHIGNYDTALNYLKQSLTISQEIGDKAGEGTTLDNISHIYHARGDYDTALSYLKQSLAIRQEIGDKAGEGTTLNNISQIFKARGDYDTALSYLKQSLAISQEISDKAGEGNRLNNISQIFKAHGDYDTALSYLKQALAIRQEISDKAGEGGTLDNISHIYHARGDYDTALSYLKQSLAIRQEIGDKSGEGATLNNISQIYDARGDYDTALSYLKQSLAIQHETGEKVGEGATLNNISQIYHARGDYDTALSYLKQALAIQHETGDKAGEGTTLNNISRIFKARSDYDTAFSYLKQSLTIRQEIGDKYGEGTTLDNISQIYDARGDYDTALSYLKQALAIRQEIGDKAGEGTTLNNISHIYHARGDYDTALSYLKQSLAISQEIGDVAGLCATLFNIGTIHMENKEDQQALSTWVQVYQLARPMQLVYVLDMLEQLADQLKLPGGMQGWDKLAEQQAGIDLRDSKEY